MRPHALRPRAPHRSRRSVVLATSAALALSGGLAAVVTAPGATAAPAEVVVGNARCSMADVNIVYSVTVRSDGSWTQRTRAHNTSVTRRRAHARIWLFPTSAPRSEPLYFQSSDKGIGVGGIFSSDTKTWTDSGQDPAFAARFGQLRGGGRYEFRCENAKVVGIHADELRAAGWEPERGTWDPQ